MHPIFVQNQQLRSVFLSLFVTSSCNFIGPLRLNLSKSIVFKFTSLYGLVYSFPSSLRIPTMTRDTETDPERELNWGVFFVKFTVHLKNFMVGEGKNCNSQSKKITPVLCALRQ